MSDCQLGNPNNSISREINIRELAYHLYIIDWYNMHLSANRISKEYIEYYTSDAHEDMSFSDWIEANGFGGELYACYNEFLEYEYRDKEYICTLLNNVELEKLYLADVETLE